MSCKISGGPKVAQDRVSEKLPFYCGRMCGGGGGGCEGALLSRVTSLPYVTQRVYLSPSMAYGRLQTTSHDLIFRVATTVPFKPVKVRHVPVTPPPPPHTHTHTLCWPLWRLERLTWTILFLNHLTNWTAETR